jgi:site-specific DNA recombinase
MCCCPSPSSSERSPASTFETKSRPLMKKGLWVGGVVPLGYEVKDRKLIVNEEEAAKVRLIFMRYLDLGSLSALQRDLREQGIVTRKRTLSSGRAIGGRALTNGPLAYMLRNRMYLGEINHRDESYPGEHARRSSTRACSKRSRPS